MNRLPKLASGLPFTDANSPNTTGKAVLCLLLGFACLLPVSRAQDDSSAYATDDDEILELSPFLVDASQDQGYLASTAQSGTRLRTNLEDIASSISVVTKDFMDDIGATDMRSLLVYTLGTEVAGVGGNFSDAGVIQNPNGSEIDYDEMFSNTAPSTRMRGLTRADLSRDFFITNIPFDRYNIERVEISRGANAMLFGLGSPAGIINNSTIMANFRGNRTEFGARVDQYGSYRGTLDHNQELVDGKFAIRVAGMYEDEAFQVEEAWRKDSRAYLTGTFKPFANTTLRASAEIGDIDSNMPEIRPPGDAYTQWWLMGKPAWDSSTRTGRMLGTPAPGWPEQLFRADGFAASTGGPTLDGGSTVNSGNLFAPQIGAIGGGSRQMILVYNDPTSSTPSVGLANPDIIGYRGGYVDRSRVAANGSLQGARPRGLRDWNYILNRVFHHDDITYGFWKAQQISDPEIFDFYNHMLHGPNKHEWADFENYNLTLEQQFLDGDAGIELAYNRDKLENGNTLGLDSTISGYTIRLDMEEFLVTGDRNPNFGRPFTTAYSKANKRSYDRETFRVTGYYNLDLRETGSDWLGKLLGQHQFTATYSDYENSLFREGNNFAVISGHDYDLANRGVISVAGSSRRGLPIMRYLGPDMSSLGSPGLNSITVPTYQWPDMPSANILFYETPPTNATEPGTWEERSFSIISVDDKDPSATAHRISSERETVESIVGIVQSHWLSGNLVTTLGWRQDEVHTFDAGEPLRDSATGLAYINEDFVPMEVGNQTESSFNYGAVLHSPSFISDRLPWGTKISLTYNKADNFRPAGQRYDIYDNPIDAETGETEEYGIMINTFDGKLVLKAAKYETISGLSSDLLSSFNVPLNNLVSVMEDMQVQVLRGRPQDSPGGLEAWNTWYNGPVGTALRNTFRFTEYTNPDGFADIDSDRRGGEVVATADVVSSGEEYELVYNPTPNWRFALNANRAQAVRTNIGTDLQDIVFNSLIPLIDGPAGQLYHAEEPNDAVLRDRVIIQVYNQMLPELANEGAPANELREWRWNAITNYTFNEGLLDGWNIGAGVRWQDEVSIGFPIANHDVYGVAPDVKNPYYGGTETNVDAWVGYRRSFERFDWSIQLNIRNIGVDDELIPVSAQPDGSIAAWRIRQPQYMSLRSTFKF